MSAPTRPRVRRLIGLVLIVLSLLVGGVGIFMGIYPLLLPLLVLFLIGSLLRGGRIIEAAVVSVVVVLLGALLLPAV